MVQGVCRVCRLGTIDYDEAWTLQRAVAEARAGERVPDTLLLLEHPPTYTLGRRGSENHLLVSKEWLEHQGVSVYQVDRGGDITFHGPGQLVGYPILSLQGRPGGPSRYLRDLEEVIIRGLASFGLDAGRLTGFTGVWIGNEKIAAIGVKINAKRITQHGFALNVSTDLSHFGRMVPCGIQDKGVTTLERVLGRPVSLEEASVPLAKAFGEVFGLEMADGDLEELMEGAVA
ncbi:MAG: lipoyl(octanoyl) transferase LipB [Acidobacteriota bacterium]